MEDLKLTNVHEALARSATQGPIKESMQNRTFREHDAVIEEVRIICDRHGTTMGAFIRECLRGLIKDYKA